MLRLSLVKDAGSRSQLQKVGSLWFCLDAKRSMFGVPKRAKMCLVTWGHSDHSDYGIFALPLESESAMTFDSPLM